jgi:hypothetical protein
MFIKKRPHPFKECPNNFLANHGAMTAAAQHYQGGGFYHYGMRIS